MVKPMNLNPFAPTHVIDVEVERISDPAFFNSFVRVLTRFTPINSKGAAFTKYMTFFGEGGPQSFTAGLRTLADAIDREAVK